MALHPINYLFRDMNRLFSDFERDFLFNDDVTMPLMLTGDEEKAKKSDEQKGLVTKKGDKGQVQGQGQDQGWLRMGQWLNFPLMDIVEEKDEYIIHMDVPGIPKENIDISLDGNVLTISGERVESFHEEHGPDTGDEMKVDQPTSGMTQRQQKPQKQQFSKQAATKESGQVSTQRSDLSKYLRYERHVGKFSRSLRLPKDIKRDKITAKCDNGVLVLCLPKLQVDKEQKKTQRINIL